MGRHHILTALALLCWAGAGAPQMKFTTVARGDQSGIEDPRTVVVRTEAEWSALWKQHAPGSRRPDAQDSRRPDPRNSRTPDPRTSRRPDLQVGRAGQALDFTKSMVVAVFSGSRPSAGHSVEITRIEKHASELVVTYREQRPAPGDMVAQVMTFPFHIVRTDAHAGPVRFERAR